MLQLIKTIIRWLFGSALLFISFSQLGKSKISFIISIILGIFIIPLSHNYILKRFSIVLNRSFRYVFTVLLLGIIVALNPETEKEKKDRVNLAIKEALETQKKEIEADSIAQVKSKQIQVQKELERSLDFRIGDEGFISGYCYGGATKEDLKEIVKISIAHDNYGIQEMLMNGTAISLNKGVKVLLLDTGFTWKKVRLLSGKYKGVAVFIPTEFASK